MTTTEDIALADLVPALLDRATPVPLHHQVAEALRERIALGHYRPGEMLPPETRLAQELGLSRNTVRQAIATLVAEGLLTRQRGLGTRIARPDIERALHGLYTLTGLATADGGALTTQVLACRTAMATARDAEPLCLRAGVDPVLRLERLRLLDGVPFAWERVHLPAARCAAGLRAADLTRPLYDLLLDACQITITRAREQVRPLLLGRHEATLLRQRSGAAALAIDRLGFAHHQPVEWRQSVIGGEHALYMVELTAASGSALAREPAEPGPWPEDTAP